MRSERIASLARFVGSLEPNANQTHAVQYFERTLDDSANRRLVIPESFLATDAILDPDGQRRRAASRCTRRAFASALMDELPFMATEELIVRAVRRRRRSAGRARVHPPAQHRRGAGDEGRRERATTCSSGSPADPSVRRPDATTCERALDPARFVGRAPRAGRRVPRGGRRAAARGRRRELRDVARRCAYDRRSRRRRCRSPLLRRGKVRDVYEVDDERLLLVATDRVSAFDVVMRETVPYKGAVLTQLTAWWLRAARGERAASHDRAPTSTRSSREVPALDAHRDRAARPRDALPPHARCFPIECVDARLHRGLGVEGVPRRRHAGRRTAARRTARERSPRSAALQSRDQGRDGARREHHACRTMARSRRATTAARRSSS